MKGETMAKNLTDIYVGVNKADANRNENDLYRTPPLATYILCKYSTVPLNVVEACAGYGNIAIELIRNGHNVLCYDLNEYSQALLPIQTGIDVLTLEKPQGYTGFVTNPPYHKNLPHKIATKAISEYDYVAMLVRITFLEGKKRKVLFDQHPPSQIIVFSDRIKFNNEHVEPVEKDDQIGGMIAYAWIIWDRKKVDSTLMKWVLLGDHYDEWLKQYEITK